MQYFMSVEEHLLVYLVMHKQTLNVAELSSILGHHPSATTFTHLPGATPWDLDLKIKVHKFNGVDSSLLVDCFHMFPPVTKHFPRNFLVASLHVYKHRVLLD